MLVTQDPQRTCKTRTSRHCSRPSIPDPNHRERGIYQVAFGVVLRLLGQLYEMARFYQSDWWAGYYAASVGEGKRRRRTFGRAVAITKDQEEVL
jgi:hypothetical protein